MWDRVADAHRQITDRPEGTLHGVLDPTGAWIWWFDDERGSEFGVWRVEPFQPGGTEWPGSIHLPPAYSAGLALGRDLAVVGSSDDDGSRIHVVRDSEADEVYLWDGPGKALWPSGWSRAPGDQRLLISHERTGRPRPMIWESETNATQDLEFDLPGEVEASWYPDGRSVLLVRDHRSRAELYRFDLETATLEHIDTEPGSVTDARVRPGGEVWYAWTRSSTPAQIRTPSGVLLTPPGEPAPHGVAYSDHDVDGVHVFVAEPPGAEQPHPTIFIVHGGPTWQDRDAFAPVVQAWVDHGFAVVLVNYRGSTGYGTAWRDALEGNPGLTELEDIAKVHDWAVASGLADPERVVLSGGSWGGYLALLGLGTQPERWSLGVAAVPVADYVAAFEDEMEPLKAFDRSLFGGSPPDIPEVYRKRSLITYVEQVRVPVMILAGENDPRCPIRQIENYLSRLRELGLPHEVYRFDAGHGSLVIEETLQQLAAEISFVAEHLGTPPPL